METKEGLKTNKYGQPILTSNDLKKLLLQGKNISHLNVIVDEEIELFQKYQSELLNKTIIFLESVDELSFDEFQEKCIGEWFFPEDYHNIDVKSWLLNKCKTQQEIDRVLAEYTIYEEHDLIMLLRLFIFLVDYMRKNKFVWGVGRGSSVSSYILFLIGVHRVDSIKYSLPISDYLK